MEIDAKIAESSVAANDLNLVNLPSLHDDKPYDIVEYMKKESYYDKPDSYFDEIFELLLDYIKKQTYNLKIQIAETKEDQRRMELSKPTAPAKQFKKITIPDKKNTNRLFLYTKTDPFEELERRWEPHWLDIIRKVICFPISIISLAILAFTNAQPHWIYFNVNSRASIWFSCENLNITTFINKTSMNFDVYPHENNYSLANQVI
jgi:hypothetical protein